MIRSITVSELSKVIGSDRIIDIRSIENFNRNHIPNAKNIPYEKLLLDPNKYLTRGTTYYIYCQKGITSRKICMYLYQKGYQVVNVSGGYEAWILEQG